MRNLKILIFLLLTNNIVNSQTRDTVIISKVDINVVCYNQLKYTVELETFNFRIYFTKPDLMNLLDTIRLSSEDNKDVNEIKCYLNNTGDSLFFKDAYWYGHSILNINALTDETIANNDKLRLYNACGLFAGKLLLNGHFCVFDKQLNRFIKVDRVCRIIAEISGDSWSILEDNLMIGKKNLYNLKTVTRTE